MICLENVSKYYYTKSNVSLGLRKVNLELNVGEFVAITGESGSGKSTLLNVISGIDSYEDGEMYFNGQPTSHFDRHDWEDYRRNNIGFVFQDYNLIDSYTVEENVESALLICGYKKQDIKERVTNLLDMVGLTDRRKHHATELSSGQKQRLAIARALAKDTKIIVADEPTGNLDSENKKQIIKLLYEISKDKLVIIVTHNYDEVEEYATRKIRMYDGEISSDIVVRNNIDKTNLSLEEQSEDLPKSLNNIKTAWTFVKLNIKSRPKKVCMIFLFMIFTAITGFVFMGALLSNADDTSTKVYSNSAFYNNDKTRIVVRHKDGAKITDDDMSQILSLPYVNYGDKYGVANDMNYYYRENIDYKIYYHVANKEDVKLGSDTPDEEYPVILNNKNYIKCPIGLGNDDLRKGSIPNKINEIVLYSNDDSMLGKEIIFYLRNNRNWPAGECAAMKMKVVGLLKEETEQVYFFTELSKMLTLTDRNSYSLIGYLIKVNAVMTRFETINSILTINPELNGNEVAISKYHHDNTEYLLKRDFSLIICENNAEYRLNNYVKYNVTAFKTPSKSTKMVFELSPDLFSQLYDDDSSYQASIYIEDYAYTDEVIKRLTDMGYEAGSPFRMGAVLYDNAKVKERVTTLLISFVALMVVYFLEIIIIRLFLKFNKNDFIILKSIGMNDKTIRYINYFEMLFYALFTMAATWLIIYLCNRFSVEYVINLSKYYRAVHYTILLIIHIVISLITAFSYNKYLYSKNKITSLKEE